MFTSNWRLGEAALAVCDAIPPVINARTESTRENENRNRTTGPSRWLLQLARCGARRVRSCVSDNTYNPFLQCCSNSMQSASCRPVALIDPRRREGTRGHPDPVGQRSEGDPERPVNDRFSVTAAVGRAQYHPRDGPPGHTVISRARLPPMTFALSSSLSLVRSLRTSMYLAGFASPSGCG